MDVWNILGINQTDDKEELKKAYRRKLAKTNPEDDPDGFMELRSAYEEAISLADKKMTHHEESDEDDFVTRRIKQLYTSFWKRIDVKEWEKLFDEDEFVSLNTSEEALLSLLKFLMSNFFIPKAVWEAINSNFEIKERKDELCRIFPEDFIEYVINNSIYDDIIAYDLFDGDEDCFDRYIDLYYKLDAAIRRRETESQTRLIEELETLDVYHPYFDVCKIRHDVQLILEKYGENEEFSEKTNKQLLAIFERSCKLYEAYDHDIFIINSCGDVALIRRDFEAAKKYYDISYELEPENYMVRGKQAEIYYYLGEYEKSRDLYMDLLKVNHYDNNVRAGMIRANQGLLELNRKKLIQNPEDTKTRLEIAWSLYQSYSFEEGITELDMFEPTPEEMFEYYNLKGRTYLCVERYDEARECFFKWKEAIEQIPPEDDSEDAQSKRKRYEYVNFLIGDCYLKIKQYDKARKYFETALKKEHEEIVLSYEAMCELEYEESRIPECLSACERLLQVDSRSYLGYEYMARSYYRLGYARETISACEHAIAIYPYVASPYELEIKVFLQLEGIENARQILARFRELGIESDRIDYAEASILVAEEKSKEAIALLVKTLNRSDASVTDMEDYSELFMMLGELYEEEDATDDAISMYEKVLELEPEHCEAYGRLGIIYRDNRNAEDALKMFTEQLRISPSEYYYIQRAIVYRHYNMLDEAESDYKEALLLDDSNSFIHSRLGLIYEMKCDYEKAMTYFDKAIQFVTGEDEKRRDKIAQLVACKARVYQCMGNFCESEKTYVMYLDTYGMNADVVYDYSELLLREGKSDEAAELLMECINKMPYDLNVQLCIRQLIYVYGNEGYIGKAYEALELAIAKDAMDDKAYASLASVFRDRGMYTDARKYYELAIKTASKRLEQEDCTEDDTVCYYTDLAEVIALDKGIFKQNIDLLLKKGYACIKDAVNPFTLLKLVRAKKAEKKNKEALEIADKALKTYRCSGCFYARCHEVLYEKGLIYESMKEYKLALECYKEALEIVGHNALYEEKIRRLENNDSRNRFRHNK